VATDAVAGATGSGAGSGGGGGGGDDGGVSDATEDRPVAPSWPEVGAGRAWIVAGALVAIALVPLTLMGPGTDLDVRAVLHSGMSIVRDGTYVASRAPGAPMHEAAVGVLERIGGTVGPNLGSLAAGIALTVLLALLLRREGVGRVGLSVAVVVVNPWFLVAATSTVDFLWALALWTGAALVLRSRPSLAGAAGAGVLAGLAVGCRSSTAFLVGGLALAELLERRPDPGAAVDGDARDDATSTAPPPALRALVLAAVAGAVGLVAFLPPFLASDASLAFAQNDVPTSSLLVQAGRFAVKDLYFVGPFAAVVLLLALPSLVRALGRWRADWLVRIGLLTVAISQLLFLRFPWKMGHLLPTLVGLALLTARALDAKPRLLAALVAAQLLYGAFSIQLVAPDNPNAATGGELTFDPGWGALVTDTRCRLDDTGAWKGPREDDLLAPGTPLAVERLGAVWDCAKPWAD